MLSVEGADGVEGDGVMAEEHGSVVTEEKRGDVGDGDDGDSDHAVRFDAGVRLHFLRSVTERPLLRSK